MRADAPGTTTSDARTTSDAARTLSVDIDVDDRLRAAFTAPPGVVPARPLVGVLVEVVALWRGWNDSGSRLPKNGFCTAIRSP